MKLSINLVHGGKYVRAGDELPSDFVLPEHLDRFVVEDNEAPQASRAGLRFSTVEGQRGLGTEARLAKPAAHYPEGKEKFIPRPKWARKGKL